MDPARSEMPASHESYYERAAWSVGTPVQDPDDPKRHGTLVRRCARLWVDRYRRPPLVRWHGATDAVPVPWQRLCRLNERRSSMGTFGGHPTRPPPNPDEPWVWLDDGDGDGEWVLAYTDTFDGVPERLDLPDGPADPDRPARDRKSR